MTELIPYMAGVVTLVFGVAFYYFLEEVRKSD
jgi:hypothetical protein